MSPDGPRPGSSGSTKEEDFRLMNGTAPQHTLTNGNCDIIFLNPCAYHEWVWGNEDFLGAYFAYYHPLLVSINNFLFSSEKLELDLGIIRNASVYCM